MSTIIVFLAVFIGIAALVFAVASLFRGDTDSNVEDRLAMLTGSGKSSRKEKAESTLLSSPLDDTIGFVEKLFSRIPNYRRFFDQADSPITPSQLFFISIGLAGAAAFICVLLRLPFFLAPLAGILVGTLPFLFLYFRRQSRLKSFGKQIPEALELISRALRAGHSLGAGFQLVASEMANPIAKEFGRCYEEQNFGISLEAALEEMTNRVPNLDLRFFATAVILQRQTGGDLAEILDKIGHLVRERFRIWGAIQALTGEGRLSGIVLLALPPVLFVVMYKMNPDYCMPLFTDPMGHKMLAGAIVMQILGALVIRKIINIKV